MTAAWLAPDGRHWLAPRPLADGRSAPMLMLLAPNGLRVARARRCPVAHAARLAIQLVGAGPLARAALMSLDP